MKVALGDVLLVKSTALYGALAQTALFISALFFYTSAHVVPFLLKKLTRAKDH